MSPMHLLIIALLSASSAFQTSAAPQSATPISPPPNDRSLLPAPLKGVVMVQVVKGRLNVPLGGWGVDMNAHDNVEQRVKRLLGRKAISAVQPASAK